MFSIASFFNLPSLSRYRLAIGTAAALLGAASIARVIFDDAPDTYQITRLSAIFSMALFALASQKLAFARANPHATVYVALLPLLAHLLFMTYQTNLEATMFAACVICLAINCALVDSRLWLRIFVITWGVSIVTMVWLVETPRMPPITVTVVLGPITVFLYMISAGFFGAREKLQHTERLLAESQSFAGVGGWEVDMENHKTRWTDTTYEILKLDPATPPDADFKRWLVDSEEQAQFRDAIDRFFKTGEPFDEIGKLRTATGETISVHSRGKMNMRGGKPVRAMGVFSDITEQVAREHALTCAKEAAEQAALARSHFIANMSHEIRTPMNGVIGMTSLLAQSELSAQNRKHVDIIRASGESLLAIINDILDFSKLEAGKLKLESKPFDIERPVGGALDLIRQFAETKGLALSCRMPEQDGFDYVGDENRLRQVLVNLLSNAVKFTEQGSIDVSVSADKTGRNRKMVTCRITDTGVGIAADKQAGLFDAFAQEDSSTTRNYGGTGLGLAICAQLLSQMGGEISLQSEKGRGSTFSFQIPLSTVKHVSPGDVSTKPTKTAAEPESLRILLAEDNLVNQKVAVMMLNKLGHQVAVADNGKEAVAAVQRQDFDIVFMDLQMPELDGLEATRLIRANTSLHQPRIIALTANAMVEDRLLCQAAGMDDFVTKPMQLQDLRKALISPAAH